MSVDCLVFLAGVLRVWKLLVMEDRDILIGVMGKFSYRGTLIRTKDGRSVLLLYFLYSSDFTGGFFQVLYLC